jgi:ABC-type dipeptide/oligopeptide/nickel transport system permease component
VRGFLFRRLLQSILVLFGAVTIIFVVLRMAPGDPAILYAGPQATQEQIAEVRTQLGLDEPMLVQYARFLGEVATLDLGESYRLNDSAIDLLAGRIPATMLLATAAILIAIVLGFFLGVWAGLNEGRRADSVISFVSLVGQAAPNFWIGIVLILVFAANMRLLPSSGFGTPRHLLLPALTLALPLVGLITRLVRAGLIEVLQQPYVTAARARGYSETVGVWRHAVRNMLIPVVTVVGLQFGLLLEGSVVVEVVFAWPGIGRLLVDSVTTRDYAVVQVTVLFIALLFLVINVLTDLLYARLDPRIRIQ